MKRSLIPCIAAAFTLGLAACSDDNSTPPGTGYFRTVNSVTGSSAMNVDLANVGALSSIANNDASGLITVPKGSYDATIKPTSDTTQNYKVTGVPIDGDNVSTVVTYGSLTGGTAGGFKAQESIASPSGSNIAVQFVYGAYSAAQLVSSVNFYVLTPGQTVSQVTPTTVSFQGASSRVEFPASSTGYEVVIQSANGTTLFDSGTGVALSQNGANVLQIFALDATSSSSGISRFAVLAADNKGAHFAVNALTGS